MDRDEVIAKLQAHEQELRAAGVTSLSLFGSLARREPHPQDVDLAIHVSDAFATDGLDFCFQLEQLERRLSGLLDCEVDVVKEPVSRKRIQDEIERDRALVF